jgi:RNA polymerase sigma-70 factor (ECF subfamily)
VAQAQEGDLAAFAALVERYRPAVLRTARALLVNHHDAEEVTQETLVQVWRELPSLREPSRFPAWLYQIARTRSRNFRARWRQATLPIDGVDWSAIGAPVPNGGDARAVQAAIERLSAANRLAAGLFYLDGYSIEEIAALLAVPAGTVKRRLHDVRRSLKDQLPELARGRGDKRVGPRQTRAREEQRAMDATSVQTQEARPGRELAIASCALRAALRHVTAAAARDARRPALQAVLLRQTDDGVALAAADGFRIVNVALGAPDVRSRWAAEEAQPLVLPLRVADALLALLHDATESHVARFEVLGEARSVAVSAGDAHLHAPLMDTTLPEAVQQIPPAWQSWQTRVTVETAALRDALQKADLGGPSQAALLLDAAPDRLRYSRRGTESQAAVEGSVPALAEGTAPRVALNGDYLRQIAETAPSREIEIGWSDPLKPMTIREAGDRGSDAAGVLWAVMPMRAAELEAEYASP